MKKIALTALVLSLGLAACQDNAPDNNMSALNTAEMEADADTNSAVAGTADAANSADNALDAAGNSLSNGANAVDNVADNAVQDVDNATH